MTTEVKISLLYSYKFTITVLECQSILKPLVHTCATSADFYTEKKGSNFSFFLLDLLRGS